MPFRPDGSPDPTGAPTHRLSHSSSPTPYSRRTVHWSSPRPTPSGFTRFRTSDGLPDPTGWRMSRSFHRGQPQKHARGRARRHSQGNRVRPRRRQEGLRSQWGGRQHAADVSGHSRPKGWQPSRWSPAARCTSAASTTTSMRCNTSDLSIISKRWSFLLCRRECSVEPGSSTPTARYISARTSATLLSTTRTSMRSTRTAR